MNLIQWFDRFKFNQSKAQSGQSVIEIAGSLIIFTLMLTLMMSISVYLYVQHAMVTAAREGARYASLDSTLAATATQTAAIANARNYTISSAQALAGVTLASSNITVTPPATGGTVGQRTVAVQINYNFANPLNVAGFMSALGADGSSFASIPVVGRATMRYEE